MNDSTEDPSLGRAGDLASTIADVMASIGEIPKNGYNDYHNYDYPLDEDVMSALREAMTEHNLIALPSVEGRSMNKVSTGPDESDFQFHTRVQFSVTLIDGDSGQQRTMHWEGEAQDGQDKGLYKAYTSGMKYWALKTFLMSAGDDVETADAAKEQPSRSSGQNGRREPSDAQMEFAQDLAKSSVWSEQEQADLKKRISAVSRSEMSDLIDDMQGTIEKRKSNGHQQNENTVSETANDPAFDDGAEDDDLPF